MLTKIFFTLLLFVSVLFSDTKSYFINVYFNSSEKVEFIEIANEQGTDYVRFTLQGAFMGTAGKNTTYNIKTSFAGGKDICQLQSAYVNDVKIDIFSSFSRVDNIKIGDNSYDIKYSFDDFESIRSGVKIFSYKLGLKNQYELKNDFNEIVPYRVSYNKL